jgi:DNA polymerase III alpha subunit
MGKKYISQVELAEANGVSKQAINQLVRKGIFDNCKEGRKLLRDCALKTYLENKDPSRDNQRETNQKDKISPAKKQATKKVISEIEDNTNANIKDTELYNQDNLADLETLLIGAATSAQKVNVIKDFWTGKINEQKFLEGQKLLIPKEQIIKDVQRILKAFKDKALALPTKISSDLIGLTEKKDVALVVESYMYELLEELSNLKDVE